MKTDAEKFSEACALEEEGKYAEALQIYLALAERGDTGAMLSAAGLYTGGRGVEIDYDKAMELEKRAADAGEAHAFYNLAVSYRHLGDIRQARHWFEKAFASGELDGSAALALAKLYMVSDKETDTVIKYLRVACACEPYETIPLAEFEEAQRLLAEFQTDS
ncbi:MAG: sel1 repeat family protein [Ottowia sp.]|nr:sel1 repeat family protein [Ottowia sp.]